MFDMEMWNKEKEHWQLLWWTSFKVWSCCKNLQTASLMDEEVPFVPSCAGRCWRSGACRVPPLSSSTKSEQHLWPGWKGDDYPWRQITRIWWQGCTEWKVEFQNAHQVIADALRDPQSAKRSYQHRVFALHFLLPWTNIVTLKSLITFSNILLNCGMISHCPVPPFLFMWISSTGGANSANL